MKVRSKIACAVLVGIASIAVAFSSAAAARVRPSSVIELKCVFSGNPQFGIEIPSSAVPPGVTPTLTLTPRAQVKAPGKYGEVCTLGPANMTLSQPGRLNGSAAQLAPAAFVGGGWVTLAYYHQHGGPLSGPMVSHPGEYGMVNGTALQGQYGAPLLPKAPAPLQTSTGTVHVTVKHLTDQSPSSAVAGLGDEVDVVISFSEPTIWLCGGDAGPEPSGVSDVASSFPFGVNTSYTPKSVVNAKVTSTATSVEWKTISPTGSCNQGNGSPDGLLPPGNYKIKWVVGSAENPSPPGWYSITTGFEDVRGGALARNWVAPLDCTCTLVPSTTTVSTGQTVKVSGAGWLDGNVSIVIGDVLVATAKATGSGRFSTSFVVPSILVPKGGSAVYVNGLQLWAIGGGSHRLAQSLKIK